MSVSLKPKRKPVTLRVELDGQSVELPRQMENSLVAIRAYLEFLALQQRRVLSGFLVDGMEVQQICGEAPTNGYRLIRADSISFEQLSRRLIGTACRQVRFLASQLEEATLRVLISDHGQILARWQEWLPQFRSPLVSLGFLRELWGDRVDDLHLGGISLVSHLDLLNPALSRVDSVLLDSQYDWQPDDAIALSAILEDDLVPWLKVLEVYLLKLDQQPLP